MNSKGIGGDTMMITFTYNWNLIFNQILNSISPLNLLKNNVLNITLNIILKLFDAVNILKILLYIQLYFFISIVTIVTINFLIAFIFYF